MGSGKFFQTFPRFIRIVKTNSDVSRDSITNCYMDTISSKVEVLKFETKHISNAMIQPSFFDACLIYEQHRVCCVS